MTPQEIAINQTGILEGESSKTGEKRKRSIGPDIESVNHQSKRYRTITPRNNE